MSSCVFTSSVSSVSVDDLITSYITANVAKHMSCKASGLAAYLSITLVANTSSSSSCHYASCDFGFGKLTHSSFILVLTDTTFLLFSLATLTILALLIPVLLILFCQGILS